MRIVIDMQGAQSSGSWNRGIGRYTVSLVAAIVGIRGEHEVLLVLNGAFPDSIERIRARFANSVPHDCIHVWTPSMPSARAVAANDWRRQSSELIREAFLASLNPDVVLVSSLFEGLGDNAVTSIMRSSRKVLYAVMLYDLIPFIHQKTYLDNQLVKDWYMEKLQHFQKADLWLAISESSRQEGIDLLGLPAERCFNISTDADSVFTRSALTAVTKHSLLEKYGLNRSFVMYTGGIDHRKNIEGLICAFSRLPRELRSSHQLAIVCSVREDSRRRLLQLAKQEGLQADELILTGFVPEHDLIALYSFCALFVFPSWHEGFGLPALEAMRCGAPVIAANTSSLPEVVGLQEALFDPHSIEAMARAIGRALTDAEFQNELIANGNRQSARFSWRESAQRALSAMVQIAAECRIEKQSDSDGIKRPRLAYVSPLPPERSGISDYSSELLPALAEYYEIDVVIAGSSVDDSWISANCLVRTVEWFLANAKYFDRVLYHFGNSSFHQHMFDLLEEAPGVVVLHDFYLSGVLRYMHAHGHGSVDFNHHLYRSHGYLGLYEQAQFKDISDIVWKYPCSRVVFEESLGIIVHSDYSFRLAQHWYGADGRDLATIPLLRAPVSQLDRAEARRALGLSHNDFIVCSYGMITPSKLSERLLKAWLGSALDRTERCHLIFVGECSQGEYGIQFSSSIKRHSNRSTVHVTGWVEKEVFRQYLAAADLAVQLRTSSRGETSAAVLDCMNYGLPTIINANGSFADLSDDIVFKLDDEFTDQELSDALELLWRDNVMRNQLGSKARSSIFDNNSPSVCADQYRAAIEQFYLNSRTMPDTLLASISAISTFKPSDAELRELSQTIATTFPSPRSSRQLLVDLSELVQRDGNSGIQRTVRNVLRHWLLNPPLGWRVEPVYATMNQPYQYARKFTAEFLGIANATLEDDTIDFAPGDVFFVLDLQPQVQCEYGDFYQYLRGRGVIVKFMVYDLLCIQLPEAFLPGLAVSFANWLEVVGENDGAVCISKAVAEQLADWIKSKTWKRLRPFPIGWSYLGADLDGASLTKGFPGDSGELLAALKSKPSFLLVGTVEPRKGNLQVLDGFELLWQRGSDINLVIVGKQGWMVEFLADRLRRHAEIGKRLFWIEQASDEYLQLIYEASTCLIAASYGEGFGLPLIEAAHHHLPIMARDIPVFREVAEHYAHYFQAQSPDELAIHIQQWLQLYYSGCHPKPEGMNWLSWQESADKLLATILNGSNASQADSKSCLLSRL